MIRLIALRNLMLKPWRSVFLLFGFSMGVLSLPVVSACWCGNFFQ